jgi:TRAP-type C4-dicarboxylate transport system substrate-binding protein
MRDLWDRRVNDARRRMLQSGIEVVEDVDHDAFVELMLPVWDRFLTTPKLRELAQQITQIDNFDTAAPG